MNLRHTYRVIFAKRFRASLFVAILIVLAAGQGIPRSIQAQSTQQKPAQQPQQPKPANNNDFPEDTNSVPVIPSNGLNPAGNASNAANAPAIPPPAVPGDDADPVRSPEEPLPASSSNGDSSSSSSLAGMDHLLNPPDDETTTDRGNRNAAPKPPDHQETAKEDIDVGSYYLSTRNWKAALSRYQSALILDPENPNVYWGLAEAQRNLKDFASARANYQKLLDYDPDNKHAKDARKLLKDPDVANAKAAPQN
jgi:tetratricopeptide (TPR) repeat protein